MNLPYIYSIQLLSGHWITEMNEKKKKWTAYELNQPLAMVTAVACSSVHLSRGGKFKKYFHRYVCYLSPTWRVNQQEVRAFMQ